MVLSRPAVKAFAPLAAAFGLLSVSCAEQTTPPTNLAIGGEAPSGAVKKAVEWLGDDCRDAHIVYFVDATKPQLVKVRSPSEFEPLLDVRLHHVRLDVGERSDIKKAVYGLQCKSGIKAAAKQLNADLVGPLPFSAWARLPDGSIYVVSDLVVATRRGAPLPGPSEFNGVTVEQALDRVAMRFHDVVTVAECRAPRRIDIVSGDIP
jgi:hypothetical protein